MNLKQASSMKGRWIGMGLVIFLLIEITAFMQIRILNDKKNKTENLLDNRGNYLVSLIALHPIDDLDGAKRDFFLRTIKEYISSEGLIYCLIQDLTGRSLLSMVPRDVESKIPYDIEMKSLYSMGLTKQTFKLGERENTIYEFSKPIFEGGEKIGTVRLGFEIPPSPLFSLERVSLLATIAFLIFATGTFAYYGMGMALRPLRNLYQNFSNKYLDSMSAIPNSKNNGGILHIMKDLEQSLVQLKEKLDKTEADNTEMATMLGVTTFEKNKISKIIDSMNFGVIITDIQDNINYINAYMLSLLNKEWKDVVDRPLGEIINHDEIISFISQQESLKAASSPGQIETSFPDIAPGELFGVSSSYLHDNEGAVIGKVSSVKNISAEKSMEQASQDFIANVAHEFLTPLTTINSYNEMLMDDEIEDKEMAKEFHNTISEEAARLTRLVQNLLSISKIEMGAMTLSTGLVKTELLVEDAFQTTETPAREKHITINKNLPDNFPSLIGDKELFKTAIINLLGNAVKYSPEKSTITFSLTENDDKVIFEISDTGYGISEEDLPHIFEKFYRSTDSQITEQKGSGLGLTMTSEIIRLHGGEIEVESELGKGTHFIISIPKEEYYLAKH